MRRKSKQKELRRRRKGVKGTRVESKVRAPQHERRRNEEKPEVRRHRREWKGTKEEKETKGGPRTTMMRSAGNDGWSQDWGIHVDDRSTS